MENDWEEALCVELRCRLNLPLDDIVEAMHRCRRFRENRASMSAAAVIFRASKSPRARG
ncbi:MAG: hypothetical protein WAV02_11955 [Stellaceae bacterium]